MKNSLWLRFRTDLKPTQAFATLQFKRAYILRNKRRKLYNRRRMFCVYPSVRSHRTRVEHSSFFVSFLFSLLLVHSTLMQTSDEFVMDAIIKKEILPLFGRCYCYISLCYCRCTAPRRCTAALTLATSHISQMEQKGSNHNHILYFPVHSVSVWSVGRCVSQHSSYSQSNGVKTEKKTVRLYLKQQQQQSYTHQISETKRFSWKKRKNQWEIAQKKEHKQRREFRFMRMILNIYVYNKFFVFHRFFMLLFCICFSRHTLFLMVVAVVASGSPLFFRYKVPNNFFYFEYNDLCASLSYSFLCFFLTIIRLLQQTIRRKKEKFDGNSQNGAPITDSNGIDWKFKL